SKASISACSGLAPRRWPRKTANYARKQGFESTGGTRVSAGPSGLRARQGGGLSRAAGVFGSMTLLSRFAGFARDWLQAVTFGTGPAVSAFVVAYRIPNYLRRIFAEGSFASAFVPVLSELRERADEAAVQDFIDHIAGALFAVVVVVTALGWLAAPWI